MAITIGQFLGLRAANPDTVADPYVVGRESFLELNLPFGAAGAGPSPLPLPPAVALSTPGTLPPPPNVTLNTPRALPLPPPFAKEPIDPIPGPPPVTRTLPSAVPPPPAVTKTLPSALPPPPPFGQVPPAALPPPPGVTKLPNAALPPPPPVMQSFPATLPPPPPVSIGVQVAPHPPPDFKQLPNAKLPDPPAFEPDAGYSLPPGKYSPIIGPADPGSQATDPVLFGRQVERTVRLGPGKVALHALTQVGLFAQNVHGNIWNPRLVDPAPIEQNFLRPAIDLPGEGTASQQVQISGLVDAALGEGTTGGPGDRLDSGVAKPGLQVRLAVMKPPSLAAKAFGTVQNVLANGKAIAAGGQIDDPLAATAFANGIIPMRVKGDNSLGFRTFQRAVGDQTDDDDVYVPLCFTDLRPVGDVFRTVYFRPIDLKVAESFSPDWNKTPYYGRVDPVASYQSTGRSFSVSWKMVAFGPEDVRTIWQKLHWLSSMVYPEYDNNLVYKSGPVVRMRIGDVVNGFGPEGGRGLPGIIEQLDYDYTDTLWELKKNFKLPREIPVSLQFTVLHDVPVGRGVEGAFGGLGFVDGDGKYVSTVTDKTTGKEIVPVDSTFFRQFGDGQQVSYDQLSDVDQKKA